MRNLAMLEALNRGKALDVHKEGVELDSGMYRLNRFIEGKDYCDPIKERWIFSIGKRFSDDTIFAATDSRFHGDRNHDCLFLR